MIFSIIVVYALIIFYCVRDQDIKWLIYGTAIVIVGTSVQYFWEKWKRKRKNNK